MRGLFVSMLAKEYKESSCNLEQVVEDYDTQNQGTGERFRANASIDGDSRIRTDRSEQFCGGTR